jgi:hypothetical protein
MVISKKSSLENDILSIILHKLSFPREALNIYSASLKEVVTKFPLILSITICILCFSYSGIHCAAWNYAFQTPAEKVLWRFSAVFIGARPLAFVIGIGISVLCRSLYLFNELFTVVYVALLLGYLFAPIFILVDVFISFRSAPPGIY